MFPNAEMMKQQTWNDILAAMIKVRDAHGWASVGADTNGAWGQSMVEARKLNVGMVGYGFMGRTHSNAFGQVTKFFDPSYSACAEGGVRTRRGQGARLRPAMGVRDRPRPIGAS